jgi:hypothetical protein
VFERGQRRGTGFAIGGQADTTTLALSAIAFIVGAIALAMLGWTYLTRTPAAPE